MPADPVEEALVALPTPAAARGAVRTMVGYRMAPAPGAHRGLPSPHLTLVFTLSGPLPIEIPFGPRVRSAAFQVPVGGLHTRPVVMPRRRPDAPAAAQRGIQLAVHPFAARAMFGVPAAALADEVLELAELVGAGSELADRLAGCRSGRDAAGLINRWLGRLIAAADPPPPVPELARAWQLIVGAHGQVRIADVAREVGWSRRHLTTRLRAEIGVGAKDLARLARFRHSRALIGRRDRDLAQVAADSGYADQSHLTAEWREFAGCSPARWAADELG